MERPEIPVNAEQSEAPRFCARPVREGDRKALRDSVGLCGLSRWNRHRSHGLTCALDRLPGERPLQGDQVSRDSLARTGPNQSVPAAGDHEEKAEAVLGTPGPGVDRVWYAGLGHRR